MGESKQVLVSPNPLGYKISLEDVDRILYPVTEIDKTESDLVKQFFRMSHDGLTVSLVERYAKACEEMTNISAGSVQEQIKEKLIDTLASAKRCFSFGESLGCIELCALHGEMLANFMCIINKDSLSEGSIIDKLDKEDKNSVNKHLQKNDFYDSLNQKSRINWLLVGQVLVQDDYNALSVVHENRKSYFHHWDKPYSQINEDALLSLKNISCIAAKHLEIINNYENIQKIKQSIIKSILN